MGGENSQNKPLRRTQKRHVHELLLSCQCELNPVRPTSTFQGAFLLLPVTFGADARIAVHRVCAAGSVFTLVILAVVDINVAVLAYVSWCAVTPVWTSR